VTELELLKRIRRKATVTGGASLVTGIGDDCAIHRPKGATEDLLYTTDLLIEDVHFLRSTHPPRAVGHKTLARGLSDIAAMGGVPRFCLVSLALPVWADTKWVDAFYAGLLKLAGETGTVLAGGDISSSEKFMADIVVVGAVPRGKAILRNKAKPGNAIYVSGMLGGSALGLETRKGRALERHRKPHPRLALGRFLREQLRVTAGMDLSDGLSIDLHRLCDESGVSAVVDRPLPVFHGASLEHALHGGEDYELLFCAGARAKVPEEFDGLPLTRIGTISKGRKGQVTAFGWPLEPLGFDHFRSP
jgi:thiamine-monophosphate kinase